MVVPIPHPAADPAAAVYTHLEGQGFTAVQLPRLLRQTADGEPFVPLQIQPSVVNGRLDLPVTLLTRSDPVRNWDALLTANSEHRKTAFPTLISLLVTQYDPNCAIGVRLTALQEVVGRETTALRKLHTQQQADYTHTCADLAQQQRALGGQKGGLLQRLIDGAFNAAKAIQLWNLRETQALKLDSVRAALEVLAAGTAAIQAVQVGLHQVGASVQSARRAVHEAHATQRQSWAGLHAWPPDLKLDHGRIAGLLAAQTGTPAALDLLFHPPESDAACLVALHAQAATDAQQIVGNLTLIGALEWQRETEGLAPDLDVQLMFGQAVLGECCAGRSPAWAGRPQGRRTLLQLTPDGQPWFGATLERGALRSAGSATPGLVGFLDLTEEISPTDLAVVRAAFTALAVAQMQQNNSLFVELLPQAVPGGGPPTQPLADVPAYHSNGHAALPATPVPAGGVTA